MVGLGPHFLLTKSLRREDVLKVLFEVELGVESNAYKFHLRIDF